MRLTKIQELGSSLEKLLSTLKKNREMISLEILRSHYRQPYYALIQQINGTASAFVKAVLTDRLILNPEKQMSACISRTYNSDQLYQMALELRRKIECALWPYIDLKTCLVFDLDNPETEPVTYNTLTRQILRNGVWANQELDLQWKFIFYPNTRIYPDNELPKEENETNHYDYTNGTENNCTPVR